MTNEPAKLFQQSPRTVAGDVHGLEVGPVPLPLRGVVARWGDEPFSRGSWTALRPGASPESRHRLGVPIDDRFVVASDATNPTAPSMVHGAWLQGRRAADWAAAVGRTGERVVIIGAGVAGLAAAEALSHQQREVVVVEARDRIGGRTHTVQLGDTMVDLGAAWMQQLPTNPLVPVVERLGLQRVRTDFAMPLAAAADGAVPDVAAALDALAEHLSTAAPSASLADVLPAYLASLSPAQARATRLAVDVELDLENGAPFDQLSAVHVLTEPGVGAGDAWLPGGYRGIVDHLAVGIDVRLGQEVRSIRWDESGVRVRGQDAAGTPFDVVADRCICCIPVWLLPTLHIEPGLTADHRAALADLAVCTVHKVVLQYSSRWWPRHPTGNNYLRWYDSPVNWGEWLDLSDHALTPTVAGLIAGEAIDREYAGRDDAAVISAAHAAFGRWAEAVRSNSATPPS
jgi:predicted NAD/FAD-dependent oxidoreductase